ncbi:MAG TPA: SxtJ family membrane protein [Candidatus Sabulitectum sp.]|nr:SxtJ family membrane protein [Candidatus Sabulitectum sp.]HPJ29391.1 SxtJ family membrane protein [Candidatus Sabulitectum sp.]HPR23120.1 SxtJ family membrane protein [Candidatus Sabulitectum sp.]
MSLTDREHKTPGELRRYGLVMAGALLAVTVLLFLKGRGGWMYTGGLSAAFIGTALLAPSVLAPVERVWMIFAGALGFVMTNVLLTIVFFLAVTPTGLLMRLFRRDPLARGFDPGRESYWLETDPDGPGSRPDKPY